MILRKKHSTQASEARLQNQQKRLPSRTSATLYFSLVLFTCFVAVCSGDYGLYRPHRPHPRPWSFWTTPVPFNHINASSAINAITASYETTTGMPVDDHYDAIIFDDEGDSHEDVNFDVSDSDWKAERVTYMRTSTPMPNITVVTAPGYQPTEMEETEAPRTPEEDLGEILESLDELLSNDSAVVTVADVADTFDQLDVLLDSKLEFPCSMLQSIDALGARAVFNGSQAVLARHNVAVVMADAAPAQPVRGLRVSATDGLGGASFEVLNGTVDPSTLSSDASDAVVSLPPSLSQLSRRVSFVVYASDRAFTRHDADQYVVNSKVISVAVANFTLGEGEVIDIHFKPSILEPARNLTRSCAYWHFAENGTGYWSQEGCIFIHSATGLLDICRCTHLTHFAEVLVPKAVFSESDESALAIISLIGCFLSLFGLFIIGLTAILFRAWRSDFNNKIWIQLTLALFIYVICFLIIVFSKFEDYNRFCFFVGILLHYAVLASFCWMLVAAIISYRKLVLIFARDPSRKLLRASAFSWFLPLVVITVLVVVAPDSYAKRFEQKTPNGAFCYPAGLGLWLTVYSPISVIILINWVLFALILRSVFATRKIKKHGDASELLRRASVSCLLVFLFGLPWVFGLFAYNIVAAYFFVLTTSYQGFVLFIFFVIINTKTRGMWLTRLRVKKKTKAPVSSSLLTNKSERVRDESEQAFIEPSSTRTNVTSLMSNSSDGKAVAYDVSRDSVIIQDTNSYKDDSDESFKTAQSFANIYVNETDDYKSIPRIVGVIEKAHSKPISDSDDSSSTETLTAEKKVSLMNDETGNDSLNGNVSLIRNNSTFLEDKNSNFENGRDSPRHKQGSDEDSFQELTIYNVSTQNASLIK